MCLNVKNDDVNKFLVSKSYRKMCSFVPVGCLLQELRHFVMSIVWSRLGIDVKRLKMNPMGH